MSDFTRRGVFLRRMTARPAIGFYLFLLLATLALTLASTFGMLVHRVHADGSIPSPWTDQDIGSVSIAGSASYDSGSSTFTVVGSGTDIWDYADSFHYLYQPFGTNGTIIAHVTSQSDTSIYAKAGVMIRASLDANSAHASVFLTPSEGAEFQRRTTTGGSSTNTAGNGAVPYWVKLVRSGNAFIGSVSSDGSNWTTVGSDSIAMPDSVYIGLAVTSHNDSTTGTATFDNVSVTTGLGPIATDNLQVSAATYLGDTGNNGASATDIGSDGSVVLAGVLPGYNPNAGSMTTVLNGGDGVVVRLSSDGQSVLSVTHVGATINDLRINTNGTMVVCGDFGVAVLDSTASNLLWNATPGTGKRCAIADDGTVVVLVGGTAYTYDANGNPLGSWDLGGGFQNDVAIESSDGYVFGTGYSNKKDQSGGPVQVPFMRAWSYTGTLQWSDYDFSGPSLGSVVADGRGLRVAVGRDGKLYLLAQSAGGNSIFGLNPQDVTQSLSSSQLIGTDAYNTTYNTKSNNITWYGRFNPNDGTIDKGQFLLTRLSGGQGNTLQPSSIMADENGQIYVGGSAAAYIQNRDVKQVAGTTVGPYNGGDAFVVIVTPDLSVRLVWNVFTASGSPGASVNGISERNGTAAVAMTATGTGTLITANALQSSPSSSSSNVYTAIWPQSAE